MSDSSNSGHRPWRPASLRGHSPEGLVFVSVDDVQMDNPSRMQPDLDMVTLVVSPWLQVAGGRFQWSHAEEEISISVTVAELHRFLSANGVRRDTAHPVQGGDAYAVEMPAPPEPSTHVTSMEGCFRGPAFDCTREFERVATGDAPGLE